jgi:hypothetical protein
MLWEVLNGHPRGSVYKGTVLCLMGFWVGIDSGLSPLYYGVYGRRILYDPAILCQDPASSRIASVLVLFIQENHHPF